ncbi:FliM/FliN family flagellar motor C-terminal domain-containing protein [Achromobacter sp. 413638]|uniref:FliM/FliN family flagellar motor C-terminal domain-containing protein n=1 Tax=Achromobacter sp. 413638 TaxID=3342385 RepID=UPI00370A164C
MTAWSIGWWTGQESGRVADTLRESLRDWCEQWGAEFAALRVEPEAFDRPPSTDPVWLALSDGADQGGVWMAHSDVATRALGAALCGDAEGDVVARSGGAMLAGAGRRAALALAEALRQAQAWHAIDSAPGALPEGVARGGLMMSVRLGQARLPLALSAGAAQRLAGRVRGKGAPLAPLQQAIGQRAVRLNVTLRPVRLEIGGLCSLSIGDVVALDHGLEEPAMLRAQDATAVAEVHLAKIGPHKAIRLDRAAP